MAKIPIAPNPSSVPGVVLPSMQNPGVAAQPYEAMSKAGAGLQQAGNEFAEMAIRRKNELDVAEASNLMAEADNRGNEIWNAAQGQKGSNAVGLYDKMSPEYKKIKDEIIGKASNHQVRAMLQTKMPSWSSSQLQRIATHQAVEEDNFKLEAAQNDLDRMVNDFAIKSDAGALSEFKTRASERMTAAGVPLESQYTTLEKLKTQLIASSVSNLQSMKNYTGAQAYLETAYKNGDLEPDTYQKLVRDNQVQLDKGIADSTVKDYLKKNNGSASAALADLNSNWTSTGLNGDQYKEVRSILGAMVDDAYQQKQRAEAQALDAISPDLGRLIEKGNFNAAYDLIHQHQGELGSNYLTLSSHIKSAYQSQISFNKSLQAYDAQTRAFKIKEHDAEVTGRLIQEIVSGQIKDNSTLTMRALQLGLVDWTGNTAFTVLGNISQADKDAYSMAANLYDSTSAAALGVKKGKAPSKEAFLSMLVASCQSDNTHGTNITKRAKDLMADLPGLVKDDILTKEGYKPIQKTMPNTGNNFSRGDIERAKNVLRNNGKSSTDMDAAKFLSNPANRKALGIESNPSASGLEGAY